MNLTKVIEFLQVHYFKDKKIIFFEEILKGYSFEKKIYIETETKVKYLLRLSDIKYVQDKEKEFKVMQEISKLDVKMSQPLFFGKLEEENVSLELLTYLEGESAFEVLSGYSSNTQYKIGYDAGLELKKMHQLKAPDHIKDWYTLKTQKNERYMVLYKDLNFHFKGEEKVFDFICQNQHLMKDRPNRFQHDDFHVGNIIVSQGKYEGVIDFNRYDYGDPLHDFYKVSMFSSEVSIPFSIGQINGYFNNQVPDDFWKLYALYNALGFVPSIVWTKKYYPEQLDEMLERLNRIYDEHKGFTVGMPTWYK